MSLGDDYDENTDRSAIEAADWVTRHAESTRGPAEQAEFAQWLEKDPGNLEAYERVSQAWVDIGSLKNIRPLAAARTPNRATRWGWVGVAGLAASACAAAVLFLAVPLAAPQKPPEFATEIAQISPVNLQDGSVVTLGAHSAIDTNFSDPTRRQVTLRQGQAFFEIAPNPDQPFYVVAGSISIRVVGTQFDVRRGSAETIISIREGVVQLSAGNGPVRTLHAGDQAVVEQETMLLATRPPTTHVTAIDPQNVAAWREGRLSYNNAQLTELVADINRYYSPGVEITPRAEGVRITASFRTDEIEGFLDDLSRAFPVEATRRPDGHYRVDATNTSH